MSAARLPAGRWDAWSPPDDWLRIRTIDAHAAGEPLRVVVSGFPEPEGVTILERRRFARSHLDHLRTALMWEPRGHADMYGCILTPPESDDGDFGILFLHNEGYSTMCGHGIIAVVTVVLDTGMFEMREPETELRIDSPAGRITAHAAIENERVRGVRFRNVPSFAAALDRTVDVTGLGRVRYDLAYGGAYYAFVEAGDIGVGLDPRNVRDLVDAGTAIKRAIVAEGPIEHPEDPDLGFLYGTIFTGPSTVDGVHSRNVCIFAEGEVDRSPTGTGVSARMALLCARGETALGDAIDIESIIGTRFRVRAVDQTRIASRPAIIPEVAGEARITGRHEFLIDPADPLRAGFLLR